MRMTTKPVQILREPLKMVVDTLAIKCKRALEQTGFKRLVMAGGVGANRALRAKMKTFSNSAVVKFLCAP